MPTRRFGGDERPDMALIEFEIAVWKRTDADDKSDPEWYTFHAYSTLPGGALFDLASYTDAQGRTAGAAVLEFFRRAIIEDELGDWERVIHDPEHIVLANDLNNLARWLNDDHYLPPTRRSSRRDRRGSSTGRSTTGTTSPDGPHEAAWS